MSLNEVYVYTGFFVVCLILSAFFSSSETAYISLQRIRVQHLVETKVAGADRVQRLISRPERLLSTVLLGSNLFNTAAAALGTALAVHLLGAQGVLVATVAVTALILIFTDITPKTLATQHAERLSLLYARLIEIAAWIFSPFVIAVSWIASRLSRMLGGQPVPRSLASPEEIRTMISMGHQEGTVEEDEAKMLHRVFDFGDRPAREVMTPRPDVIAIEQGSKLRDFLSVYMEHPLSRFPVYRENMDNVVGILAIKDALMSIARGADLETSIDELIRPAYFAPEIKRISELFREMQEKNYHMCVIVDEYGGTAGIISLSRLMEEVVGEVGDEMAALEKDYEIINDYTFQIDGSMRIEEVNQEMGLWLPDGDYETVAGFILCLLGHIPKLNEQVRYKGMKIVITEMRGPKIERVLITKEGPRPVATPGAAAQEESPRCGTGEAIE